MRRTFHKIRAAINRKAAWLISISPWYRAFLRAAMNEYENSLLYRLRATEFGDEFAMSHFADNHRSELPLFKDKIKKNKKLMARIILAPFSVNFRGVS